MNVETWFVLSVAAAFLLLGIAGSPLAWVALHHRKSQLENLMEQALERADRRDAPARGPARAGRRGRTIRRRSKQESASPENGRARTGEVIPTGRSSRAGVEFPTPRVEARGRRHIPDLRSESRGRLPTTAKHPSNSLSQRYAAIWTLADQGASPEVIAKATGQPIGQIELILGLRRHIDGSRTTIPHAPHA